MMQRLRTLWRDEGGQDIVEYALLAAALAIVAIPAVAALGESIAEVFDEQADELQKSGGGS